MGASRELPVDSFTPSSAELLSFPEMTQQMLSERTLPRVYRLAVEALANRIRLSRRVAPLPPSSRALRLRRAENHRGGSFDDDIDPRRRTFDFHTAIADRRGSRALLRALAV